MLQVSLLTQDIVDARHHFVPLIVIPISKSTVYNRPIRILLKHYNKKPSTQKILAFLESHSPSLLAWFPKICPKICSSISGLHSGFNKRKKKWDSNSNKQHMMITQAVKHTLPEAEIIRVCMARRYGWVMGNLRANTQILCKQLFYSNLIWCMISSVDHIPVR